jgi:hypothetical protein
VATVSLSQAQLGISTLRNITVPMDMVDISGKTRSIGLSGGAVLVPFKFGNSWMGRHSCVAFLLDVTCRVPLCFTSPSTQLGDFCCSPARKIAVPVVLRYSASSFVVNSRRGFCPLLPNTNFLDAGRVMGDAAFLLDGAC